MCLYTYGACFFTTKTPPFILVCKVKGSSIYCPFLALDHWLISPHTKPFDLLRLTSTLHLPFIFQWPSDDGFHLSSHCAGWHCLPSSFSFFYHRKNGSAHCVDSLTLHVNKLSLISQMAVVGSASNFSLSHYTLGSLGSVVLLHKLLFRSFTSLLPEKLVFQYQACVPFNFTYGQNFQSI